MPYRLRIKFPGGSLPAPITLSAAARAFVLSGKQANLIPPTTIPVEDVWVDVTPVPNTSDNSPYVGQGWWKGTLIEATGDILIHNGRSSLNAQGNPQNLNSGTFYYRKATKTWEKVGGHVGDDWWKYDREGTSLENYDSAYDPDRHRAWMGPGAPMTENSPHPGEMYFDCSTNEFTVFSPLGEPYNGTTATWLPSTVEDQQHWRADRLGLRATKTRIDPCIEYMNGKLYSFGGWNTGDANLWIFDPVTEIRTVTSLSGPRWHNDSLSEVCRDRAGKHRRENYLWTIADNLNFWVLNLNDKLLKWRLVPTTGVKPVNQLGLVCELHEDANCIVTHNGNDAVASVIGPQVDECFVLDLSTLKWRASTKKSLGSYMPSAYLAVGHHLLYDPVDKVIRSPIRKPGDVICQVWEFTPKYTRGTLTGFPLPTEVGGTYGVNYVGFPYVSNSGSKHTNMAYCPLNNRIYVAGGDTQGSGTEGTWSMDLVNGSWVLETGQAEVGGPPVPVDAQDGMGFEWDAAENRGGTGRNKFIFWPGAYFRYVDPPDPRAEWAKGYWTFDPITKVWEQDLRLWGNYGESSGGVYGGCWDKNTDIVYVVGNSSGSATTRRYNLTTGQDLGTLTWANASTWKSGSTATVFYSRNRHVLYNGEIYVFGQGTPNGSIFFPMFAKYTIATNTMQLLSTPPVDRIVSLEARAVISGDKIIWPAAQGPDGEFPDGILIYHPAGDFWTTDYQTPPSGVFIGNAICATTDGLVCFSGGVFGRQQSHFWMYQPAS